MAIAAVILMLFLIGTTEVALLFQDETGLANITRVAARDWSLGDTLSTAQSTAVASSQSKTFTTSNITWTFQYSTDGGTTWTTSTSGTAPSNSLVRVQTSFVHAFSTKLLGSSSITLTKGAVYHHE